ncbi:MAG: hypothetical protein FWF36_05230 [Propionibacteriaceae bacterium]|nr:hypothetical protein [Propionibacteriaceae bacterium]
MVTMLLLIGLVGCSRVGGDKVIYTPSETVIEATASIPPDVLGQGQLVRVEVGGQLWVHNTSMPFGGVRRDADRQPIALVWIDSHDPDNPITEYPLHLGETVAINDYATVTLVSFDKVGARGQAVTFLFKG